MLRGSKPWLQILTHGGFEKRIPFHHHQIRKCCFWPFPQQPVPAGALARTGQSLRGDATSTAVLDSTPQQQALPVTQPSARRRSRFLGRDPRRGRRPWQFPPTRSYTVARWLVSPASQGEAFTLMAWTMLVGASCHVSSRPTGRQLYWWENKVKETKYSSPALPHRRPQTGSRGSSVS